MESVITFNYRTGALKSDYSFDMQELNNQQKLQLSQDLCQICCVSITKTIEIFNPSLICYNCWHQHIKANITKISYKTGSQILSPFEGGNPIDICVALNSLQAEHAVELEEWLFKKYSSFTADIQKCPSETCDYVFMMEKCKWRTNQEEKCPKCEATLVPSTSWDIKGLIGFIYFLFLTNKCPKCEIPIEKTTGCPHMTCPCGHQFCWYCLKDYFGTRNNVYSVHEPRECAFIFISKIIFMSICTLGIILTFLGNEVFHAFIALFFVGLKYLLLTLFIDLILISNFLMISHIVQKVRNIRIYGYDNGQIGIKFMITGLVGLDLMLLVALYFFEMYTIIGWILLIEAGIAAVGAIGVWLIIYSVETWFDYIC